MSEELSVDLSWIVLTLGNRTTELGAAIESIRHWSSSASVIVVENGADAEIARSDQFTVVHSDVNLGVPGGRDFGARSTRSEFIGFLDDDAVLTSAGTGAVVVERFRDAPRLGAIAFRIGDEHGRTARRHVPRIGRRHAERPGNVTTFLGGACAIRRSAYDEVGGYWADLFYAHEELDLAWRLHDAGYDVDYVPSVVIEHPHTPISRHADGWRLTGRNRVMIARRNLPWPIAAIHVTIWLAVGLWRTPDRTCRRSYLHGWLDGWRHRVPRQPIRWRTVWRLTRLGRPPFV